MFNLREPLPRSRTSVWRQRCDIGCAADLLDHMGARKPQLIVHHDVQRCPRQPAQFRCRHIAAKDSVHRITCRFEQTDKLVRIVPAAAVSACHTDEIDGVFLRRTPLRQSCRKHTACRLVPTVCKTAGKSARVERDNRAGQPHSACNRLNIVADESRRAAADDGEQGGRLLHIGRKNLAQILLRTEYDRIVIELRTDHAMRDRRLTVLNLAHRKKIAPERAVDNNNSILDARKERRCSRECTSIRAHTDIIEGCFTLTHRSALPYSHTDAKSAAYRPADGTPSTSRPTAAVQERAGAASYRQAHAL